MTILRRSKIVNGPATLDFRVILHDEGSELKYVVHCQTVSSQVRHHGHYYNSLQEAEMDFLSQCNRYHTEEEIDRPNRFSNAHLIINPGACNPSGVTRALVAAIDEARLENPSTKAVCEDPACRLICYQLAFLMGMEPLTSPYSCWSGDDDEPCKPQYLTDLKTCEHISNLNLTPAQFETLRSKWEMMGESKPEFFWQFLMTVTPYVGGDGCVIVPWCGMTLGVEVDGYAHS